jgi:methylenetetrahydrofolate reductase (NADH)
MRMSGLRSETKPAALSDAALTSCISELARGASVELNVHDLKHLEPSRRLLAPGSRIYVSHLPKQTWQDTVTACRAIHGAGFQAVPHIPVRLMSDAAMLDRTIGELARIGRAEELLLIAGDYSSPVGPYAAVEDVLREAVLEKHGIRRVSVAAHPEGHPKVPLPEIRRAEKAKLQLATQAGLTVTFVTQFAFESAPVLDWLRAVRSAGTQARLVAGLAGPCSLSTLFRFALRCGVGPSIRALGAGPTAFTKLMGDRGPEPIIRALAQERAAGRASIDGIHLFSFGGYLRSCEWLHTVGSGRFRLNDHTGFEL